jgi:cytidylate kinase
MVRVITIDGPSGAGKGTIAAELARRLGWRVLDSGALYRLVGLAAERAGVDLADVTGVCALAKRLNAEFRDGETWLEGEPVGVAIRTEHAGKCASKVASLPPLREILLHWQRAYARQPGLVADGRDMGSVVFPDAQVKIFLDASAEERALRRCKQLIEKGIDASLADLKIEIEERDRRDRSRATAPLIAAPDALLIDSTGLSIEQVLETVIARAREAFPDLEV